MTIANKGNNFIHNHNDNLINLTSKILPQSLPIVETSETITKNSTEIRTGGDFRTVEYIDKQPKL